MQVQDKPKKIESGEIPEGWKGITLSELCDIRKPDEISSSLYIGLEHIGQGTNNLVSRGSVIDFTSNKHVFHKGDVLYGKLRPLLNKVYLAKEDGFCSTDILPLKIKEGILGDILLWHISSDRFVQYADSTSSGTKMPRTNWNNIKEFKIALPSLKEQQKIASIISKVDELIQKTDQIIEQTQRLKKGLMKRLLTKGIGHIKFKKIAIGEIPEIWEIVTIDEITKNEGDIITGPFGSMLKKEIFVPTGYKIYGQENVIPDDFVRGDYYISEQTFFKMKKYEIKPKDILISLVGSQGKVSLVPDNIKRGIINPRLLKITIDQSRTLPEFMKILLSSNIVKKQLERYSHGLTMGILNKEIIKRIVFPNPPMTEQTKIVSVISKMDALIQNMHMQKNKLEILKIGLMQKLLTGKIRVKI